ncbi:MAG: hypothetical protein ACI9OF_002101, partial [Saprospiraceae bacterium]
MASAQNNAGIVLTQSFVFVIMLTTDLAYLH